MKHILTYFIFLLCFNSLSAQTTDSLPKKLDPRFVGSWSGSEKDNLKKGLSTYWIQHRILDGTYLLLSTAIPKKGEVESFAERGKWWIENGLFHELHFVSGKTDIYTFEVLDDEHIKFKLKSTEFNPANSNYEFIDTKIEEE